MAFDFKKFKSANFSFREKEVEVVQMKEFFENGDKPVFKIRGLTGEELFQVRSAVQRAQNIEELVSQLSSGNVKQKVSAALDALGLGNGLPDDYVMRLRILHFGSVEPDLDMEHCKKIADAFPTAFTKLTDEIQILTGAGKLGESKPSGTTRKSK